MQSLRILSLVTFLAITATPQEAEVISLFTKAGARITTDKDGRATKLFSGGKPAHSTAELQRIGELKNLEQIALNAPEAGDDEWGFVHQLPKLNQLTIWHCKTFRSLTPFSGLKIEGLTVGGCMGLRDLNKAEPEKQLNAILTLKNLPNLKRLNLYHSPLAPLDAHLEHIASQFPRLEDLKLDFSAPRGAKTATTPAGLRHLSKLPLKVFSLENVGSFTAEHMKAIAEIKSLETVLIDARRGPKDVSHLAAALRSARPDLEVQVAVEGSAGPPTRKRK